MTIRQLNRLRDKCAEYVASDTNAHRKLHLIECMEALTEHINLVIKFCREK